MGSCLKNSKYLPLLFTFLAGIAFASEKGHVTEKADTEDLEGSIKVVQDGQQLILNSKNLGKLKTITSVKDAQYSETNTYKGIYFSQLLEKFYSVEKLPRKNAAILIFRNGMRIPIYSVASTPDIDPFIAFSMKSKEKKAYWHESFPSIGKPSDLLKDPRPIEFKGNKLAVTSLWHPDVHGPKSENYAKDAEKLGKKFSPWRHIDSLVEIQLVDKTSYFNGFPKGKSEKLANGFQTFVHRCQFCHSVNNYGANYGWDFVSPLPIHAKRKPKDLMNHVKYPYHLALERGLMMPTQEDFNLQEAEQLWHWLYFIDKGQEAKSLPK